MKKASVRRALKCYTKAQEELDKAHRDLKWAKADRQRLPKQIAEYEKKVLETNRRFLEAEACLTKPLGQYAIQAGGKYGFLNAQVAADLLERQTRERSWLAWAQDKLSELGSSIKNAKDLVADREADLSTAGDLLRVVVNTETTEDALRTARTLVKSWTKPKQVTLEKERVLTGLKRQDGLWVVTGKDLVVVLKGLGRKETVDFCGVLVSTGSLRDYGKLVGKEKVLLEVSDTRFTCLYDDEVLEARSVFEAAKWQRIGKSEVQIQVVQKETFDSLA